MRPHSIILFEMVSENKLTICLTADIFLLNIIIAIAAYKLSSKIKRIKSQWIFFISPKGVYNPSIYKQNIPRLNMHCSCIKTSRSSTSCNHQKFILFMPMRRYWLWPERFLCHFMKTQMKSNVSVKLHFMNTSKF